MSAPDQAGDSRLAWLRPRLAVLMPSFDDAERARIAHLVIQLVEELLAQAWTDLLQRCAAFLPRAARIFEAAGRLPLDAALVLPGLPALLTPQVLLCLPDPDRADVLRAMLAHPQSMVREQTLDALTWRGGGCEALRDACAAGSRRMLLGELDQMHSLSHLDRLSLREMVLGEPSLEAADP